MGVVNMTEQDKKNTVDGVEPQESKRAVDFREIDRSNVISSDGIDDALDTLKGITGLLSYMSLAGTEYGSHGYESHAYYALEKLARKTINDFEELKPKIDYMWDYMHQGQNVRS